jgi:hypothetical protein
MSAKSQALSDIILSILLLLISIGNLLFKEWIYTDIERICADKYKIELGIIIKDIG